METVRLGQLLVQKKMLKPSELEECLQVQQDCSQKLGEILVQKNLVSETILEKTLKEQYWRNTGFWVIN